MGRRWIVGAVAAGLAVSALSLTRGQERGPASTPPPSPVASPARDFSKLNDLQKQMLLSARRGADWLYRMNEVNGRFLPGWVPSLRVPLEGDHYLSQAGAAFALARAARFTGDDRYAARAAQALLALFDETEADPKDPHVRYPVLPPAAVNRLGAAGILVLAVHELPAPQADLLDKAEQLCNYVRRQARPDGSLALVEGAEGGDAAEPESLVNEHPGVALYGLMRSQKHRPAGWKTDLVRKAAGYYRGWWLAHKSPGFVPWQTAAYAEAYLRTHDAALGDFVEEMNDFLCGLQYAGADPRRLAWHGGFRGWSGGRPAEAAPGSGSAAYAGALAEAARVARERGDTERRQRYAEASAACLQFLTSLQYGDGNTGHFADWYRPRLVGGFHASHQDGTLRIEDTEHAVAALVGYLEHVAR